MPLNIRPPPKNRTRRELLYVQQLHEGTRYVGLMPSIGISVLNGVLFPEVPDVHLDFRLRSQKPALTLSDALQIHLLELPKYAAPSDNEPITEPLDQWSYFFLRAQHLTIEELTSRLPHSVFIEAARALEMISRSPDDRALYEARLKLQRDEQSRLEAAEARGRAEGRAEGRAQGELIGKIQLLQGILDEPEQSSDVLTPLSGEELNALLAALQKRLRSRG